MIELKKATFCSRSNYVISTDHLISEKDFLEMLLPWGHLLTAEFITIIFSSTERCITINDVGSITVITESTILSFITVQAPKNTMKPVIHISKKYHPHDFYEFVSMLS